MSGRSATTSIARMTGILGTIFLINCLALAVVFNMENQNQSIFDDTNEVGAIIQTVPEGESNTLSTDTIETAPLTEAGDSSDGVTPLADETLAVGTPEIETTPEASDDAAQEPKPDE